MHVWNISASRGNKSCVRVQCFSKNDRLEPEHYKSVLKIFQNEYARVIGHRNNTVVRTVEEACISAEIRDGAIQSLVPQKFDKIDIKKVILIFELNLNLHSRHSCNQNIQNIVTWGQNMSANIEEFACISMGGLFSGVPLYIFKFSQAVLDLNFRLWRNVCVNLWYLSTGTGSHWKIPHLFGLNFCFSCLCLFPKSWPFYLLSVGPIFKRRLKKCWLGLNCG